MTGSISDIRRYQALPVIPKPRQSKENLPAAGSTKATLEETLALTPALRVISFVIVVATALSGVYMGNKLTVQAQERILPITWTNTAVGPDVFQSLSLNREPESHQHYYWDINLGTRPPPGTCNLATVFTDTRQYTWVQAIHSFDCASTTKVTFELPEAPDSMTEEQLKELPEDQKYWKEPIQVDLYAFSARDWNDWHDRVDRPKGKLDPDMISVKQGLVRIRLDKPFNPANSNRPLIGADPLNTLYYTDGGKTRKVTRSLMLPDKDNEDIPSQAIKPRSPRFEMTPMPSPIG